MMRYNGLTGNQLLATTIAGTQNPPVIRVISCRAIQVMFASSPAIACVACWLEPWTIALLTVAGGVLQFSTLTLKT